MSEPTRYAATVIAPGLVRTKERDYPCPDAVGLPVGSRIQVEIRSDSGGEQAVMIGAGQGSDINGSLAGWRTQMMRDRWGNDY